MSYIQIKDLYFCYPDGLLPLFDGLTLRIDGGWKLGLVGDNGRGKTTLLRLLCGELPCRGIDADVTFRRFPVDLSRGGRVSDLAQVGDEWKLRRELRLLGLDERVWDRPLSSLSGGERTKAMLAATFSREGYALIDEPTDHLDGAGRVQLGRYLAGKEGFLVVSHDRAFLDDCCDHIFALERGGPVLVRGNYGIYAEEREKRRREEESHKQKLEGERTRLARSAERASRWAESAERSIGKGDPKAKYPALDRGYLGAKAAKGQKRTGAVAARAHRAEEEIREALKTFESEEELKLFPEKFFRRQLLLLEDLSLTTDRPLFSGIGLAVNEGDRIAVTGGNGSGKSTLLSALCGNTPNYALFSGKIDRSPRLKISYLSQMFQESGFLADYAGRYGIELGYFNAVLKKFGFESKDLHRDLSLLSEGQKKKVALCRSLCERAHLYLWDEPLNYLDTTARERLEEAVLASSATVIFVEHDRSFTDRVATKWLSLE